MPHLRNLNLVVPEKIFQPQHMQQAVHKMLHYYFVWETTTLITYHKFNNLMSYNAN